MTSHGDMDGIRDGIEREHDETVRAGLIEAACRALDPYVDPEDWFCGFRQAADVTAAVLGALARHWRGAAGEQLLRYASQARAIRDIPRSRESIADAICRQAAQVIRSQLPSAAALIFTVAEDHDYGEPKRIGLVWSGTVTAGCCGAFRARGGPITPMARCSGIRRSSSGGDVDGIAAFIDEAHRNCPWNFRQVTDPLLPGAGLFALPVPYPGR